MAKEEVDAEKLLGKRKKSVIPGKDFVSTGSTLLNLQCTSNPDWGIAKGQYMLIVGRSSAGKSWLARSIMAEASVNKHFADHELVYDDSESASTVDIERFFGRRLADRMELLHSSSLEEFYYELDNRIQSKRPFIWVEDSMDALEPEADSEQFEKEKNSNGKETSGSYGTAKAKINSTMLRRMVPKLRDSGSILVIISQARQRIGFGSQFNPDTRAGGNALKFYAHLEVWLSVKEDLKSGNVKGKKRQIGILSKLKVEKNRLTGREGAVEVPIYWSHGIDDTGSLVDYLIEEKHWKGNETKVTAPEFQFDGPKEKLISQIQDDGNEDLLKSLAKEVWDEIEAECQITRKPRYE